MKISHVMVSLVAVSLLNVFAPLGIAGKQESEKNASKKVQNAEIPGQVRNPVEKIPLQQQYRNTIADLKVLSKAIDDYIWDKKKAPPVKDLDELLSHDMGIGLSFIEFYMDEYPEEKIPRLDAWGNRFVYKFSGDRYWLGSGGSNGKFFRFDQKGAYRFNDKEMADRDIVFSNGGMVFGPLEDHRFMEFNALRETLISLIFLLFL